MGGELGNESYIDVPLVSSALSPPKSTLFGNTDYYTSYEISVQKLVLLGFRGYLGKIESAKIKS